MIRRCGFILLLLSAFKLNAQEKSVPSAFDRASIRFSVSADTAWTALLKRSSGWFGGDGIYTIPLNGAEATPSAKSDQSMIIFSDSMIGAVSGGTMQPGYKMIHNSYALLRGSDPKAENLKFYSDTIKGGEPESVFIPRTANTQDGDYYWLGDGFVNTEGNGALYIFGYRVRTISNEAFGFREVGNTLLKLNVKQLPGVGSLKQRDTPFYLLDNKGEIGSFGAGIYVNTKSAGVQSADGYVYVYGVRGMKKNVMVARVQPKEFENFSNWQFWDGSNWVADMNRVADVTSNASNELSVSQLPDGRYVMVFQVDGMSTSIGMRLATRLTGPWGPIIKLWDCKEDLIKNTFVVYNAKAHPNLSQPNELLISYNINSVDFINDLKIHPHLYRPRFIRVKFQ